MRTPGFVARHPLIPASLACAFAAIAAAQVTAPPATPSAPPPQPTPEVQPLPAVSHRADVEPVLAAMAEAVVKGDVDAYLKHISPRSPYFLVEQREWAKDLLKPETRPTAFSATITKDGKPATRTLAFVQPDGKLAKPAPVNAWTATVRFQWTMPTTGPANVPNRSPAIEFPVLFLQHPTSGAWQYAGESLASRETPAAIVYYPEPPEDDADAAIRLTRTASRVAEAFPLAKAHDDEFFGRAIDRVEEIRLFSRRDVLQFSVYPSMFQTDTTLSGWSEPGQSIKFLTTYATSVEGWKAAFSHEYGHVCTWNLGPKAADMPWWVQEGIAELAAEPFAGGRDRVTRQILRWAKDDKLAPWDQITDYRNTPTNFRLHPYHQGHHLLGFIVDTFTREKAMSWLAAMATGKSLDDATSSILGLPFADLDARWRKHIADLSTPSPTEPPAAPKDPK